MKIFRTRHFPPKHYDAINILGVIFCHPGIYLSRELINHERIHTAQMIEMGFVFFYIWYLIEWLFRLFMKGRAYTSLAFEREAYAHMDEPDYLKHRRPYAWTSYLRSSRRKKRQ